MPSEASVLLYGWRSNHPLWRNQVRHKILVLDLDLNFKYLFIFQLNVFLINSLVYSHRCQTFRVCCTHELIP